jgi:hypothetical protein
LRAGERGNDPLAELARLIGRYDPYAEFGLSNPRSSAPEPQVYSREEESRPPAAPTPAREDDWRGPGRTYEPLPYPDDHAQAYRDQRVRDAENYTASPPRYLPDQGFEPARFEPSRAHQDAGHQAARLDLHPDDWRYQHQSAHHLSGDDAQDAALPAYDEREGYDEGEGRYAEHHQGDHEADRYPDEEASLDPDLEQVYDDPPHANRRGGLATALALIGCAMLGTAGAYAYRSYHSQPAAVGPAPVIAADNSTPTKIVPAGAGDSQLGKVIQDRVADAGREQIISKQEEPVAEKDLGTQAVPRVVLPAPVAPVPAVPQRAPVAAAPQAPAAPGALPAGEPRKVRTVTIRPDGTEAPAPSASRGVPPLAKPAAGGPLSLDPQAREPAAAPTAKPRVAAAPAPAVGGGFLVQLSSQKTEAEAAASFRSLQAKFPDELASRSPIIRRADLGAKGVFYRAMVGPFASAQEASQFCASFKAAGGNCVVPGN